MDAVTAIERSGGAATWAQLRRRGVGRGTTLRRLAAGEIQRPTRDVYALAGAPVAVVAAAAVAGVLSCAAAALDHGLPVPGSPGPVHLTVPRSGRRRWGRVVVHRRDRDHDGTRTGLVDTVLDCLGCLPLPQGVAVADAALHSGRVELDDLTRVARSRRGMSARLALVDPAAQSPLESVARVVLRQAGLPVRSQVRFEGVGHVDLLVGDWLVVETDGREHHGTAAGFAEDRRRDRAAARQGLVVLRYTWSDVVHRPTDLVTEVLEVLDRGRPPFWPRAEGPSGLGRIDGTIARPGREWSQRQARER